MTDIPPGMYPGLQRMAQGPMAGFAGWMMHAMEQRRQAAGISPEDWQAQIDSRRAAHHAQGFAGGTDGVQHLPELGAMPAPLNGLGGLFGGLFDQTAPAQGSAAPDPAASTPSMDWQGLPSDSGGANADPTMHDSFIMHLLTLLHGGQQQQGMSMPFGGF